MAVTDSVRVIDQQEGYRLLDEAARKYLNMPAADFLEAWDAGRFAEKVDEPEVMRVASLIHFAR